MTPVTGYETITSTAEEGDNLRSGITLPAGIYYLKETQAPDGYAMLDRMVRITVDEKGITASWDDDTPIPNETKGEAEQRTTLTISIPNTPGIEMPETGGPGTGLFTALGAIMTALAGAALTLKKRKEQT